MNVNNDKKSSFLLLFVLLLGIPTIVKGQKNNTNMTLNTNTTSPVSTPSPTQSPSTWLDKVDYQYPKNILTLPWGEPSFGGFVTGSNDYYSAIQYLLDTRRYGWSWTPSYLHKSAPFCYDTGPRPLWVQTKVNTGVSFSNCYDLSSACESLGGTVYNDILCIENPAKPFTIVGPVCWNETCYNEKTFKACKAVGGQFIGGQYDSTFNVTKYYEDLLVGDTLESYNTAYYSNQPTSEAAWCAVPGKHTVVGPTCFGLDCFNKELSATCSTALNGTSFADIFCLVDKAYTVIGPICRPIQGNATADSSLCYPEETAAMCQELEGTSIGDIFCIVKGEYSVLGPFCTMYFGYTGTKEYSYLLPICNDASDQCISIGGSPLGNGTFCILKGEYTFVRPEGETTIHSSDNTTETPSWCDEQGGTKLGVHLSNGQSTRFGCILPGKYSIIGPMSWGETQGVRLRGTDFGDNFEKSTIIYQNDPEYVILKGEYSVYGPSCYGPICNSHSSDCLSAGGTSFGSVFCAVADDGSGTTMKKDNTSDAVYNNIISTPATIMLCLLVTLKLAWGNI